MPVRNATISKTSGSFFVNLKHPHQNVRPRGGPRGLFQTPLFNTHTDSPPAVRRVALPILGRYRPNLTCDA